MVLKQNLAVFKSKIKGIALESDIEQFECSLQSIHYTNAALMESYNLLVNTYELINIMLDSPHFISKDMRCLNPLVLF